ncbi:hypothetical protein GW17_00057965, partial [Ensete ventricosum]
SLKPLVRHLNEKRMGCASRIITPSPVDAAMAAKRGSRRERRVPIVFCVPRTQRANYGLSSP